MVETLANPVHVPSMKLSRSGLTKWSKNHDLARLHIASRRLFIWEEWCGPSLKPRGQNLFSVCGWHTATVRPALRLSQLLGRASTHEAFFWLVAWTGNLCKPNVPAVYLLSQCLPTVCWFSQHCTLSKKPEQLLFCQLSSTKIDDAFLYISGTWLYCCWLNTFRALAIVKYMHSSWKLFLVLSLKW